MSSARCCPHLLLYHQQDLPLLLLPLLPTGVEIGEASALGTAEGAGCCWGCAALLGFFCCRQYG